MPIRPSANYIARCSDSELVELAFDAQRDLTTIIERTNDPAYTEAEYEEAKQYRATIKAELVRRMGAK